MDINRRRLLVGAGSLLLSPAVVRADALMPVSSRNIPVLVVLEVCNVRPHPLMIRQPLWVHRSELITKAGQERLMRMATSLGEPWHQVMPGYFSASSYFVGASSPEEERLLKECAYQGHIIFDGPGRLRQFFPKRLLEVFNDTASR